MWPVVGNNKNRGIYDIIHGSRVAFNNVRGGHKTFRRNEVKMHKEPFTETSIFYDAIYQNKAYKKEFEFIEDKLGNLCDSNGRILEIGCGTGNFTKILMDKFKGIDALDISKEMVTIAKGKTGNKVNYHVVDFEHFSIKNSYQGVYSLFHVASYLGERLGSFLDFSYKALTFNQDSESNKLHLCFDFYDHRGVQKVRPTSRSTQFEYEGKTYIRSSSVLGTSSSHILIKLEIEDIENNYTVAREVHKMSIFEIRFIKSELAKRGFRVVEELDLVNFEKYSGNSYGNCVVACLDYV